MTKHDAVEFTCTTAGSVLYYSCSTCHKNFVEKEGKTELTETAIPVTEHTWDDNVCTVCHYDAGGSKGLADYLNENKPFNNKYYCVTGIGTCIDTEIEIPEIYNGKPGMSIVGSAFYDCNSLADIAYRGTKAEWKAIEKGYRWDYNTGNYTVHCTDGGIKKGERVLSPHPCPSPRGEGEKGNLASPWGEAVTE